jgi:nucleotide-binding universal stress UspA family protein
VQSARPILGAFKDTAVGRHALSAAAWLARSLDTPLLLAHAFDPTGIALPERRDMFVSALSEDDLERGARLHARRKLEAAAQTITGVEVRTELTEGTPDPALLGLAAEHRASLLVIGSAGRAGLDRVLGGSLPADVAVRAPCPVVVVTADAALEGRGPVVAGYDGSEQSGRAARYAATLAEKLRRDLVLVHATGRGKAGRIDPGLQRQQRVLAAARPGASHAPDVRVVREQGDPVQVLAGLARDQDAPLIVTGWRGRNVLATAALGSVTAALVATAGRPIGVVPAGAGDPWSARPTWPS